MKMKTATQITGRVQVIASPSQYAITDFGRSLAKASRCLPAARFTNGCVACCYMFGFATRAAANMFAESRRAMLAYQAGRLGRWITPTFHVVKSAQVREVAQ